MNVHKHGSLHTKRKRDGQAGGQAGRKTHGLTDRQVHSYIFTSHPGDLEKIRLIQ